MRLRCGRARVWPRRARVSVFGAGVSAAPGSHHRQRDSRRRCGQRRPDRSPALQLGLEPAFRRRQPEPARAAASESSSSSKPPSDGYTLLVCRAAASSRTRRCVRRITIRFAICRESRCSPPRRIWCSRRRRCRVERERARCTGESETEWRELCVRRNGSIIHMGAELLVFLSGTTSCTCLQGRGGRIPGSRIGRCELDARSAGCRRCRSSEQGGSKRSR
jgi:hypothetical protein